MYWSFLNLVTGILGKELTLPPISCSLHALSLDAASAFSFVKLSQACFDAQFAMLFNTTQI